MEGNEEVIFEISEGMWRWGESEGKDYNVNGQGTWLEQEGGKKGNEENKARVILF